MYAKRVISKLLVVKKINNIVHCTPMTGATDFNDVVYASGSRNSGGPANIVFE